MEKHKRKSIAWDFFEQDGDPESAQCKKCHVVLKCKGGSTSGMIGHIRKKHLGESPDQQPNDDDKRTCFINETVDELAHVLLDEDSLPIEVTPDPLDYQLDMSHDTKEALHTEDEHTFLNDVKRPTCQKTDFSTPTTNLHQLPLMDNEEILSKFIVSELRQLKNPKIYNETKWAIQLALMKGISKQTELSLKPASSLSQDNDRLSTYANTDQI